MQWLNSFKTVQFISAVQPLACLPAKFPPNLLRSSIIKNVMSFKIHNIQQTWWHTWTVILSVCSLCSHKTLHLNTRLLRFHLLSLYYGASCFCGSCDMGTSDHRRSCSTDERISEAATSDIKIIIAPDACFVSTRRHNEKRTPPNII